MTECSAVLMQPNHPGLPQKACCLWWWRVDAKEPSREGRLASFISRAWRMPSLSSRLHVSLTSVRLSMYLLAPHSSHTAPCIAVRLSATTFVGNGRAIPLSSILKAGPVQTMF